MEGFAVSPPGLVYLKANKSFTGSHKGMWYRLWQEDGALRACVWPMPWNYAKTPEAEKTFETFAFDAPGLEQAGRWVEERYAAEEKRWAAAPLLPPDPLREAAQPAEQAGAGPGAAGEDTPPWE